ncbi:N-acetylmuramoyl-L-alanine amidase [Streptomyces sp. NPDC059916]|uniref:N-acetylmuramoyl-L-alanine amidase n=1 Tax=Streptomyces sp. NPDC059916 TaxID=3347001 RepID=UPI00369847B0
MAKTGPQRYPGASTAYWYQTRYGGDSMESNVIVWHTTEGTSLPTYGGGAEAPNLTAKPNFAAKRLEWFQHFDFDTSSRALVNKPGGVQTNTLNVCQVEIVGTCDPSTHAKWTKAGYAHLYTPELPDWAVRDLAAFAAWANANHGVPLSSGLTFKAYPSSYGNSPVRMSGARWDAFQGHCGHQHVPENDHGDPGELPMAAILTAAKGGTSTAPKPTMPAPTKPVVDLSQLIAAARTDPGAKQGHVTYKAGTNLVEAALVKLGYLGKAYAGDGSFGSTTITAYSKWQRHLGYTGKDADGIPGMGSLNELGQKSGLFGVVA